MKFLLQASLLLVSSSAFSSVTSTIRPGHGWISSSASCCIERPSCQTRPLYHHNNGYDDNDDDNDDEESRSSASNLSTRRHVLCSALAATIGGAITATAASTVLVSQPSPAYAATIATTSSTASTASTSSAPPSTIVSNTLCDPSVSTWVKTTSNNLRTIHILGTAHISSASAELAGMLVRDLKPDVVFVELDAKRVSRAIPGGAGGGTGGNGGVGGEAAQPSSALEEQSNTMPAPTTATTANNPTATITSTPTNEDPNTAKKKNNPFDLQSKLVNVGSKYVGNAVKGMYGKLESEGFKAGDEFAMSVREGLAIGSTIVLGDRDVEVTLQRLTRALAKTDIRKLLSADSEVEKSMEGLLPDTMKKQLEDQQQKGGATATAGSMGSMGMDSSLTIDKQEFNTFVETMKAKENVKKIMGALKATAPEIYEAMVAERDVYMARGLDELDVSLNSNEGNAVVKSAATTVAVMGMAHVDGVETYLASKGWKELRYPCPVIGGL